MPKTTLAAVWLIALMSLALETTPILGAEQKTDAKATKKAPPSTQTHMIMAKDPVTGKLRQATVEEVEALNQQATDQAKATKAKPAAPRMIQGPGGAVGMILDDTSTNVSNTEATRKAAPAKAAKKQTGTTNDK